MNVVFRTHDLGVRGLQPAIEKLKACDLNAVQLVAYKFLDEIAYKPGALTEEKAQWLGSALKQAGVEIPLIGAYFNPVHSNKQKVADCKQVFKDYLTHCKTLGCPIVGSETGSFNDDKWTYNPLNRTEEALQTVISTFTELADYAASLGVNIGMEGAAGHVCWNVATLNRAITAINRSNVKVIFDIYNYLDMSNYDKYLDILDEGLATFAGKIVVFHIKDCVVEDGKLKQVAVGKGMFDFDEIFKRIKAYDINARLVLEGTSGDDIVPCTKFVREKWAQI